jgi:CO/xanthine dehydrogenase FAD-binding subunit
MSVIKTKFTETDVADLQFEAPTTLSQALGLMSTPLPGIKPLAGGTDLIVQMRSGRLQPQRIVDLKRIPELIGIKVDQDGFLIGAATPCFALGEHAALRAAWPGVVEAARLIGSTQIQGRASLGGNICNGSPAADSVPALIAARAICVIGKLANASAGAHSGGELHAVQRREIPVELMQAGPGRNCLTDGELLLAIRLPAPTALTGDAYLRLIPRTEMDIAVVGAGVCLTLDSNKRVVSARLALGAVAHTALWVKAAEQCLVGSMLDVAALTKLEAAARAACKPIDDKRGTVAYRTQVAGVLARRAALIAYARAQA